MIQLITKFFGEMFLLGRLFFRLEAPLLVIMGLGVLLTILKALFCFTMSVKQQHCQHIHCIHVYYKLLKSTLIYVEYTSYVVY